MSNTAMPDGLPPLVLDLEAEFAVLERLPAPLREYLNTAPIKFSAIDLARTFAGQPVAAVVPTMHGAEERERFLFATRYERKHRHEYPHTAADATVLR